MSKKLTLFIFSCCTLLSFVGSSQAAGCSGSSSWDNAYIDASCHVPTAIQSIKNVIDNGNFYTDFLKEQQSNSYVIILPTTAQRASYNANFTGLIYTLRFNSDRNSPSKLAVSLQPLQSDMRNRYNDSSLSNEDRTRFVYLYFLTRDSIAALQGTYTPNTQNGTTNNSNNTTIDGLTQVESYTALNNRSYTIRQSSAFYLFSRASSTNVNLAVRASSLGDLINYIEFQNRIIVVAPNGRYYGIRKHDGAFKVNRDNGSVLDSNFASFDAAKQMIDTCAVNRPVPYQYHQMCGFDTYGNR